MWPRARTTPRYPAATGLARPLLVVVLASCLGGDDDPDCPPEDLEAWRGYGAAFTSRIVPGNHFFLHDEARFLPVLRASLARPGA